MSNDAAVSSAVRAKADFPDWLSPMLVKELRQGMRSRQFLICFLALQAAMIFPAIIGLMTASISGSTQGVTVFFWIIVGVPLLLIMPFSGLGAISREKTGNTLELIFLTRLTARRIVFGKWVAIIAQTLLLVSAILPYAVLRYYLGGVNITGELTGLGLLLAASALLTSFTVGISPVMGRVGRVLMPIGLVFGLQIVSVISVIPGGSVLRASGVDWKFVTVMALEGFYMMLLMLETGAGKIGPAAENHSTPKRLVALASVLTALLYSYVQGTMGVIWLPALLVAGPVLVGAVCEPIRLVPSVYRPFLRLGFAGRALGWLLYPGWPSGVFFSLLVLGIAGFRIDALAGVSHMVAAHSVPLGAHVRPLITRYVPTTRDMMIPRIVEVAILGAFFTPPAFFRLLKLRISVPVVFYFLLQAALALLSVVGVMATDLRPKIPVQTGPSGVEEVLACIPTCTLVQLSRIRDWDLGLQRLVLEGLVVVTVCLLGILLVRMFPEWRTISALLRTAASLPPEKLPPDAARPAEAA